MFTDYDKDLLAKSQKYEEENAPKVPENQRPKFHFSVPVGWSNDPNGLSYYKEKYHLFFQYNPYDKHMGGMHWGHCISDDMIRWEYLPIAMAPDTWADCGGCFSGSAVEYEGKQVLMYTGNQFFFTDQEALDMFRSPDRSFETFRTLFGSGRMVGRQVQNIAIGDGVRYTKIDQNPVIPTEQVPKGMSVRDFRDPKMWKEDGKYWAVIGGCDAERDGKILLFSSEDFIHWEFVSVLHDNKKEYGTIWECPDFFPLDGKYVIMASPMEIHGDGLEFPENMQATICAIGSYDKENHKFIKEAAQMIDYGVEYYAPQSLETPDGRRVQIGWMESFANHMVPDEYLWYGAMTLPREIHIRDHKLYQLPIKELENYYADPVECEAELKDELKSLPGIQGRYVDFTVNVAAGDYEEFFMELAAGEVAANPVNITLHYTPSDNLFTIDRTASGVKNDIMPVRSMRVADHQGQIKVRVIMDNCALEIFVNDGEQAMSALCYIPESADQIRFGAKGKIELDVKKYNLVNKAAPMVL